MAQKPLKTLNFGGEDTYYLQPEFENIDNSPFDENGRLNESSMPSHTHGVNEITDFPTSMTPTAHTHTKSEITDFPTSMTPTAHTHTKSEITDFPSTETWTFTLEDGSTVNKVVYVG